jgi:hypothetical protein
MRTTALVLTTATIALNAAYAQTPDVINWCNRYNRNPVAAARCIRAETGQVPTGAPLEQAVSPPVQQPAQQQPADPYADAVNNARLDKYLRAKAHVLDEIRLLGYAGACQAVHLLSAQVRASDIYIRFYSSETIGVLGTPHIPQDINQAMQEGATRAQSQGCDFFKERPELVLELRREVGS